MTSLIGKEDADEISRLFRSGLMQDVRVLLFTSKTGCPSCSEAEKLLGEVASLADRVKLEVMDKDAERERAEELGVELVPTTVIIASNGSKLHYAGSPWGRQLASLVQDILDASNGRTQMDEETRAIIGRVKEKTVIKVFVTPFCPYSPLVVRSAHRFALENPLIRGLMVETLEFPEQVKKYNVLGVPRTVINERFGFDGAPDEKVFAEKVLHASASSAA